MGKARAAPKALRTRCPTHRRGGDMIATMNWALFYFAEAMALLAGGCLGFALGKQRGQNDVIDRVAEAWNRDHPAAVGVHITEGGGIFYATGPDGRV